MSADPELGSARPSSEGDGGSAAPATKRRRDSGEQSAGEWIVECVECERTVGISREAAARLARAGDETVRAVARGAAPDADVYLFRCGHAVHAACHADSGHEDSPERCAACGRPVGIPFFLAARRPRRRARSSSDSEEGEGAARSRARQRGDDDAGPHPGPQNASSSSRKRSRWTQGLLEALPSEDGAATAGDEEDADAESRAEEAASEKRLALLADKMSLMRVASSSITRADAERLRFVVLSARRVFARHARARNLSAERMSASWWAFTIALSKLERFAAWLNDPEHVRFEPLDERALVAALKPVADAISAEKAEADRAELRLYMHSIRNEFGAFLFVRSGNRFVDNDDDAASPFPVRGTPTPITQ
jgi:hypothetical protein